MRSKKLLGGAAVIAVSLSFTAPVSAMPSDIREGIEHDLEVTDGLVDDSALLENVGTYYVAARRIDSDYLAAVK